MSRERLEAVYRERRQGLYTLALSIAGHPEAAEDAVHDAFSRLFTRRDLPEDLVPYVFASVRNAARDARNRRPAPRTSIFDGAAGAAPDPARDASHAEEASRARASLEALAEPEREAIVLKLYAGLTFDQIASALDAPLSTVASRYRRGLERIRKEMERG